MSPRETAARLLTHYFRTAFQKAGADWNYDNDGEIEQLVDALAQMDAEAANAAAGGGCVYAATAGPDLAPDVPAAPEAEPVWRRAMARFNVRPVGWRTKHPAPCAKATRPDGGHAPLWGLSHSHDLAIAASHRGPAIGATVTLTRCKGCDTPILLVYPYDPGVAPEAIAAAFELSGFERDEL